MPPRRQNTLAARIKSLMRADEEVGKIAQAAPVVIGGGPGSHQHPLTNSRVKQDTSTRNPLKKS